MTAKFNGWLRVFYRNNFTSFGDKHATADITTQTIDDCKFSCQINEIAFKEWMNAIPSMTKTDALL